MPHVDIRNQLSPCGITFAWPLQLVTDHVQAWQSETRQHGLRIQHVSEHWLSHAVHSVAVAAITVPTVFEQAEGEDADEWEQWPDVDVDISSSDGEDGAACEIDASMYSGGGEADRGARTRAQRRARRRGTQKRQRGSADHRAERAHKRRRLQEQQYAEDSTEEEELEEYDKVQHVTFACILGRRVLAEQSMCFQYTDGPSPHHSFTMQL